MPPEWPLLPCTRDRLVQAKKEIEEWLGIEVTEVVGPKQTSWYSGGAYLGFEKPDGSCYIHPLYLEAEEKTEFSLRVPDGFEDLKESFSKSHLVFLFRNYPREELVKFFTTTRSGKSQGETNDGSEPPP